VEILVDYFTKCFYKNQQAKKIHPNELPQVSGPICTVLINTLL
jgi:hypothetical protein